MFELSKRISSYLVRCGLPKKNEAIYTYGIEILLNCSCTILILTIFALISKTVLTMYLWLFSFFILRSRIGGLHMDTNEKCIISSSLLGISCILLLPALEALDSIQIILFLPELLYIFIFTPFPSAKTSSTSKNLFRNKAISCILYVFLYFAGFFVSNSSSLFGRAIFLGIHISIFLSALACMNYYFKEYLYD